MREVILCLSLLLCILACTQACPSRSCNTVNCRWGAWSAWSVCSGSKQYRRRAIATAAKCSGTHCAGSSTQSKTCNIANSGSCSRSRQVSRAGWGAAAYKSRSSIPVPVKYVFIHHTATPSCTTDTACKARMRSIQNYHQTQKNWSDIGYNWLVGEDGRAYEGRNWPYEGAHTFGYNRKGVAVSVIGSYVNIKPNAAALQAVQDIIACGVDKGYISPNYELFGHRDAGSTPCPGSSLYSIIKTWPRFSTRTIPKYKR